MGQPVASSAITVTDDPLLRRGLTSRPFDGEGVEGQAMIMVDKGVLAQLVPVAFDGPRTGSRDQWTRLALGPQPSRRPRPIWRSSLARPAPRS